MAVSRILDVVSIAEVGRVVVSPGDDCGQQEGSGLVRTNSSGMGGLFVEDTGLGLYADASHPVRGRKRLSMV